MLQISDRKRESSRVPEDIARVKVLSILTLGRNRFFGGDLPKSGEERPKTPEQVVLIATSLHLANNLSKAIPKLLHVFKFLNWCWDELQSRYPNETYFKLSTINFQIFPKVYVSFSLVVSSFLKVQFMAHSQLKG